MAVMILAQNPDVQTLTGRVGCRADPWLKWPGFGPESSCLVVPVARKCIPAAAFLGQD